MSKVTIDGLQTRVPGVRAKTRVQDSSGVVSPIGRVVVVEELPFLERGVVTEVRSERALKDLAPWHEGLQNIAHVLYHPANDRRVSGGPNAVLVVSPNVTTQAKHTLLDTSGNKSVLLEALSWGTSGNRTKITLVNNADDATKRDLTIARDGITEPYVALGTGKTFDAYYSASEATAVTLLADRVNGVRIRQTKATIAVGTYTPSDMAWDGTITVTPSAGAASGETYTVTVTGIDKSTGAPATEVLSWDDADTTDPMTTAKSWSDVTSIEFAVSAGTPTFTVSAFAFDLGPSAYANLGLVVDRIASMSDRGYTASKLFARLASVPTSEIDTLAEVTILGSVNAAGVRADLWDWLAKLAGSVLVEATRDTTTSSDGTLPPVALSSVLYLSGGTEATAIQAGWEACFAALTSQRINSVWCGSTDAAVHAALKDHLVSRVTGVGANTADAVVGAPASQTLAQMKTRSLALNTRHVTLCGDKIRRTNAAGNLVWMDPKFQALEIIGMQSATAVGEPQTRKVSRSVDIAQAWDPALDADALIEAGILAYQKTASGVACLSSVTTYQQTESIVFRERSANESFNYALQLIADAWDELIGSTNARVTKTTLLTLSRTILRQAIQDEIILWFDEDTLDVTPSGDVYRLDVSIAPVLPFNHGLIYAEAVSYLPTGAQ